MPPTTLHLADSGWEVHKVVVGPVDNNVFVLRCTATGDALLVCHRSEAENIKKIVPRIPEELQ